MYQLEQDLDQFNPFPREGLEVDQWCICTCCIQVQEVDQRICCRDYHQVDSKIDEYENRTQLRPPCITGVLPGFINVTQDLDVLQAEYADVLYWNQHRDQAQFTEVERWRHCGYRMFVRWIFGHCGRWNRKILPSCVTESIHRAFPNPGDVGYRRFRYPPIHHLFRDGPAERRGRGPAGRRGH